MIDEAAKLRDLIAASDDQIRTARLCVRLGLLTLLYRLGPARAAEIAYGSADEMTDAAFDGGASHE